MLVENLSGNTCQLLTERWWKIEKVQPDAEMDNVRFKVKDLFLHCSKGANFTLKETVLCLQFTPQSLQFCYHLVGSKQVFGDKSMSATQTMGDCSNLLARKKKSQEVFSAAPYSSFCAISPTKSQQPPETTFKLAWEYMFPSDFWLITVGHWQGLSVSEF